MGNKSIGKKVGLLSLGQYKNVTVEMSKLLNKKDKVNKIEGIVSAIISKSTFFIDEFTVNNQVNMMIEGFKRQLVDSNITLEEYLKQSDKDYDTFFAQLKIIALEGMKKDLVFAKIAESENIFVTKEEVTDKINEFARISNKSSEQMINELQERGQIGSVYKELLWNKIVEFLLDNNSFTYNK